MRRVAGCALIMLLAVGCGSDGPTLDEAARTLAQDAKRLEAFHPAANKKIVDKTGKDGDDFASCSHNETALRFYQLSGDFGEGGQLTPEKRADLFGLPIRDELKKIGYEIDRNASWEQFGRSVVILRKQDPGITFIVLVQASTPNLEIIGKTDCLRTNRQL